MTTPPERRDSAPARPDTDSLAYRYDDPPRETVVSIFGGASRSGPWAPPEQTRAISGFGNVTLDFTQADLPAGITEVDAWALFGTVEIRVPASLEVELSGIALIGNLVHRSARGHTRTKLRRWLRMPARETPASRTRPDEEAVLCVRGTALFGNVVVKVV